MRDGPMEEIGAKYEAVLTAIGDDFDSVLQDENVESLDDDKKVSTAECVLSINADHNRYVN